MRPKFQSSKCVRHDGEPIVQNGLAVTPSEMNKLRANGFSITGRNAMLMQSADPADNDFYVPLQYRRGFDVVDLFDKSNDIKKKFKDAVKKYDKGEISDVTPKNA